MSEYFTNKLQIGEHNVDLSTQDLKPQDPKFRAGAYWCAGYGDTRYESLIELSKLLKKQSQLMQNLAEEIEKGNKNHLVKEITTGDL